MLGPSLCHDGFAGQINHCVKPDMRFPILKGGEGINLDSAKQLLGFGWISGEKSDLVTLSC